MKKRHYHYTMCGLDNVYLENGFTLHTTDYGAGVSIDHADLLDTAIATAVVCSTSPLTAKEFRFLRSQLDLTQLEMAGLLGFDTQTIARWEKDECDVNPAADRLVRLIYLDAHAQTPDIDKFMWRLSEDNKQKNAKLVLKAGKGGHWKPVKTA
jgi:DNA-binding transcriptional regulator YiaG